MTNAVYLALAWLAGIALGAQLARPWPAWLACALAGALAGLLGRHERGWRLAGALLAAAALGALRLSLSPLHASPLRPYLDGPPATLTGVVAAAPEVRATRSELVLRVESLAVGEERSPLQDAVLVRIPRETGYRYGDRLRVSGRLATPPETGDFSYRDYLARRGVHAVIDRPQIEILARGQGSPLQAALIALADRAEVLIHTLWPTPESALLAGILLGRENAIPEPLLTVFNDTGTRHIIAISGFNITLLAGTLTALLLNLLNRRLAAPMVILLLAFYTVLVGGDAAVVRAAVMGGLTLLAVLAGRRAEALTGLGLSGLLMTLGNPWTLWEPSFQLSFAATLGLIVLEPRLEAMAVGLAKRRAEGTPGDSKELVGSHGISGACAGAQGRAQVRSVPSDPSVPTSSHELSRVPSWLREAVLVSLAAQIATLPITLGTFGRLSLVAPLANLLILPVQAAVMELGALATVLGLLWRPLGQLLAYLAWPFVAYTIRTVELLGRLPWAAVDFRLAGALPWALYALGGFTLWARQTPERWQALRQALTRHLPTKALLTGLGAATVVVWTGVARAPDGRLHVTFLDVGQGDAIFIQTPDGKQLLIDGGPDPTLLSAALGRRLPPWDRSLDLVALTHPDEDHVAGLVEALRRYRAGLILDTRLPRESPTGQAWAALTTPYAVQSTHYYPARGTVLDLGSGARLQVLHPGEAFLAGTASDDNNNGLVLRLTYGRASFLLTGDLGMEGELHLLAQQDLPLDSTVLKVAHHGAKTATTLRFLEAVTPRVAVISVGAGNRFGHPAPEVLERLEEAGAEVWRTDECGDIEIVTDGERLWVSIGGARVDR